MITNVNAEAWANAALDNELQAIREMPTHNVNKPGSPFFVSLLKIASIVRAGYVPRHVAETAVRGACSLHDWIPPKEIEYQWRRALKRARPRHPAPARAHNQKPSRLPKVETAVYHIVEIDLVNGHQRVVRHIGAAVAGKAEELARMLRDYLGTGELPEAAVTLTKLEGAPGGVLLRLSFRSYSQRLADCVLIACKLVGGTIMRDLKTGVFDVWLKTACFT